MWGRKAKRIRELQEQVNDLKRIGRAAISALPLDHQVWRYFEPYGITPQNWRQVSSVAELKAVARTSPFMW